ncbi:MAG: NUDIX hydrolase, partial [Silvanigrellaceae bacterium]|nr:NUDIX hydrolase [Silvanigrellaceae bacterium]
EQNNLLNFSHYCNLFFSLAERIMNEPFNWIKWISEVQAIAQSGLAYTTNPFDKERFLQLRELIAQLAAYGAHAPLDKVSDFFSMETGYATPKLDVRAFILQDNKLLLVKERFDGLWTLPGGWADVNESPAEAVVRETWEEAGYEVRALKLLALWDKHKHDHPMQWPHTYKCFFHCDIQSGEAKENLEISDQDFFALDDLPPLSLPRVTPKQLVRLYELVQNSQATQFD